MKKDKFPVSGFIDISHLSTDKTFEFYHKVVNKLNELGRYKGTNPYNKSFYYKGIAWYANGFVSFIINKSSNMRYSVEELFENSNELNYQIY